MKDKVFGVLQRVGRSFMLPIALLPIAGLLLGIGSFFTNPTTLEAYNLAGVINEGGLAFAVSLPQIQHLPKDSFVWVLMNFPFRLRLYLKSEIW